MRPSIFHVFLVRPSKYDDEGFLICHWRAVVPSNSLACLYGLVLDWGAPAVPHGRIGTVLRIDRLALNALRDVRPAAGFLMALMTVGAIGKANPEHRSSEQTLDICPVPPADTGG